MAQNCQSDLDVRYKEFRDGGIYIHGNRNAVRLQFLPGVQEHHRVFPRCRHIFFQINTKLLERHQRNNVESLDVREFERLGGGVRAKSGREAFVMVQTGIVVTAGSDIDQSFKRRGDGGKSARRKIVVGTLNFRWENLIHSGRQLLLSLGNFEIESARLQACVALLPFSIDSINLRRP